MGRAFLGWSAFKYMFKRLIHYQNAATNALFFTSSLSFSRSNTGLPHIKILNNITPWIESIRTAVVALLSHFNCLGILYPYSIEKPFHYHSTTPSYLYGLLSTTSELISWIFSLIGPFRFRSVSSAVSRSLILAFSPSMSSAIVYVHRRKLWVHRCLISIKRPSYFLHLYEDFFSEQNGARQLLSKEYIADRRIFFPRRSAARNPILLVDWLSDFRANI